MPAQSNLPVKFLIPFAQNDVNRVEVPVTTADSTRASQSLGFPPLTMQPPEAGGVPPQGEDFNGAMNQVARIAWWLMMGGAIPFDNAFATASQINGYPSGAVIATADLQGQWISLNDNNTDNPDTGAGTKWVPLAAYGALSLSGQTGGATTLTPAQAAKRILLVSGTLTSALTINLPAWIGEWRVFNNTTGAFATTVKTVAGTGVTIPQNGLETRVRGDGTNIVQDGSNLPLGTRSTQPITVGQAAGIVGSSRKLRMSVTAASATATMTADEIVVETALGGARYCLSGVSLSLNLATTGAGGMDTGSAPANGYVAIYAIYNPSTGVAAGLLVNATSSAVPNIYGGGNMPAGYTASALVAVVPTSSSQFVPMECFDRRVRTGTRSIATISTQTVTPTLVNIAAMVPPNAAWLSMVCNVAGTSSGNLFANIYETSANGIGQHQVASNPNTGITAMFEDVMLPVAQSVWYTAGAGGTMTLTLTCSGYSI